MAARNAPDQRARHGEILAVVVGVLLLTSGVVFNVLHLVHREFFDAFFWFRLIIDGLVFTLGFLYLEKETGDSMHAPLLLFGCIWFVVGICTWFAG